MATSVWPFDYLSEPHHIDRKHGNHLIVFLLSPFSPKERYDELLVFCQSVCAEVGRIIHAEVECIRADSLSTPNVIHQDIWSYIQMGDAIIADVSDRNGNVMLELGVAASFRDKDKVIIICDQESEGGFLFDISPARHLIYRHSLSGAAAFRAQLIRALLYSLAPAPYVPPDQRSIQLPMSLDLSSSVDSANLVGPSNAHRRLLSDGLEFGSFYVFRYSWLTLGLDQFRNIRLRAEMRFTELHPDATAGQGWVGIMLRSPHFFADYGHLVYVVSNGAVQHTQPVDEFHKEPDDPLLGQIPNFKLTDWVHFDLLFDEQSLGGSVGGITFDIPVSGMPFTHNAGHLRFQTYLARACLKSLEVEALA